MAEKLVFKNFSISTGLILVNNKNLDWILACEIILDLEMFETYMPFLQIFEILK